MKKWLCILIFLTSALVSFGQTVNPFELIDPDDSISNFISIDSTNIIDSSYSDDSQMESPDNVENLSTRIITSDTTINALDASNSSISNNPFDLRIVPSESLVDTTEILEDATNPIIEDSTTSNRGDTTVISELSQDGPAPTSRNTYSNIYMLVIGIFSGLLLSILLTYDRRMIQKIAKGLRNNNYMNLLQKEQNNGFSYGFTLLYIVFVVNLAAFLCFLVRQYGMEVKNQSYWWFLLIVIGIVILRHLIMTLMNMISRAQKEVTTYYFGILSTNAVIGIILLPINLLIAFGPEFLINNMLSLGLIILAIGMIIKWLKGITNSLRLIFSESFHFFLYLCTAEILPILVGIRVFSNLM